MLFEELKQRRTIRKYTGEDIPEKLLNELIETACRSQPQVICNYIA